MPGTQAGKVFSWGKSHQSFHDILIHHDVPLHLYAKQKYCHIIKQGQISKIYNKDPAYKAMKTQEDEPHTANNSFAGGKGRAEGTGGLELASLLPKRRACRQSPSAGKGNVGRERKHAKIYSLRLTSSLPQWSASDYPLSSGSSGKYTFI